MPHDRYRSSQRSFCKCLLRNKNGNGVENEEVHVEEARVCASERGFGFNLALRMDSQSIKVPGIITGRDKMSCYVSVTCNSPLYGTVVQCPKRDIELGLKTKLHLGVRALCSLNKGPIQHQTLHRKRQRNGKLQHPTERVVVGHLIKVEDERPLSLFGTVTQGLESGEGKLKCSDLDAYDCFFYACDTTEDPDMLEPGTAVNCFAFRESFGKVVRYRAKCITLRDSCVAFWQWQDDDGMWRSYTPEWNAKIEYDYAHAKQESRVTLTRNKQYRLEFRSNRQFNCKHQSVRPIRRIFVKQAAQHEHSTTRLLHFQGTDSEPASKVLVRKVVLPHTWNTMDMTSPALVDLTPGQELDAVLYHLNKSQFDFGTYDVHTVQRVQNAALWEQYTIMRSRILAFVEKEELLNEKRLFHGTLSSCVPLIVERGFDWRLSGSNGSAYGKGSYFSKEAGYCNTYAKEDNNRFRRIIMSRVLIGNYTHGKQNQTTPPCGFHSCVNRLASPLIYVTFDQAQAYPEYVIVYRRKEAEVEDGLCSVVTMPSLNGPGPIPYQRPSQSNREGSCIIL